MSLLLRTSRQIKVTGSTFRAFSAEAAAASKKFYDVPEGHLDSDLSQNACNIGLNRRRDLKLGAAGQIELVVQGETKKISDLLKGQMTVLFGVPNRGSVCSEKHLPGYMKELDKLRQQGVTQILCVSVGDRDTVYEWGKNVCPSGDILVAADPMGKLTRLFGMELDPEASPGNLTSMRYAMALDDGIILKVKLEKSPGDVKETSAKSILEFLQSRH